MSSGRVIFLAATVYQKRWEGVNRRGLRDIGQLMVFLCCGALLCHAAAMLRPGEAMAACQVIRRSSIVGTVPSRSLSPAGPPSLPYHCEQDLSIQARRQI